MSRCTFTGNRNGVDDRGSGSTYRQTLFWRNNRGGGTGNHATYELAIKSPEGVTGCIIDGEAGDLLGNVSRSSNSFGCAEPELRRGLPAASPSV